MNETKFVIICAILSCMITSYALFDRCKLQVKGWKYWLFMILNSMILGLSMRYSYPYGKIGALLADTLFLSILIQKHRGKLIFRDISFALLLGICEFVSYPIYIYAAMHMVRMQHLNIWINALCLTSTQIFLLFVYHFYKRTISDEYKEYPFFMNLFQVLILPIFSFINVSVMMMLAAYYMDDVMLSFILLNMVFVVLLNVYLFYLFEHIAENIRLKQQAARLEEMSKMQYSYYHNLEAKYQNSRKVIHDVNRHLQVIEAMQEQDQMQSYIQNMKETLHHYTQEVYSKHPILNVILQEKMLEAKRASIEVTYKIAPVDFRFMKDTDVTVVFANLLDNAIDACKEVNQSRYLSLQIDQVHHFLVIIIENSRKAIPLQGKSTKVGHEGLGLVNVRQTIESYGGNMQMETDEQSFKIHLYVPIYE